MWFTICLNHFKHQLKEQRFSNSGTGFTLIVLLLSRISESINSQSVEKNIKMWIDRIRHYVEKCLFWILENHSFICSKKYLYSKIILFLTVYCAYTVLWRHNNYHLTVIYNVNCRCKRIQCMWSMLFSLIFSTIKYYLYSTVSLLFIMKTKPILLFLSYLYIQLICTC